MDGIRQVSYLSKQVANLTDERVGKWNTVIPPQVFSFGVGGGRSGRL
jgi:hypothetical protein